MNITRRSFNILAGAVAAAALVRPTASFAQSAGTVIEYALEPAVLTQIDRNGPELIAAKILDGLIDHDADLNPVPSLALSWETSADALRHTFKLRDGVKWHDGEPFTSADVAYSLLTLKQTHPRRKATFANLVDVETPDALTVVLVFSKPAPFLYGALGAGAPIFPRHLYEGVELATNPVQSAPIGTGPFVFREWARGSHVVLERNPDYWGGTEPQADRIVIRFIPDLGARVAALETGELEIGGPGVPLTEIDRLTTLPNLTVATDVKNFSGAQIQFFFNLDIEILKDIRVRRAIAHSLDIPEVISTVFRGHAKPAPSAIGPNLAAFHDPSIKPYAFDIELANRLLDEADHPRGADGTRFELRILANPFSDQPPKVAEYLRSALERIGIRGSVVAYDYATYVTKVYTERAFDIEVEQLANGYDPTDGVQRGFWSKAFKPGVPWSNAAHYSNPRVDAIFEEASAEPDLEKRKALYFELQAIVYAELPSVGVAAPVAFEVYNARLDGVLDRQSQSRAKLRLA
ncbi:ABC transporter substrate-binding protein [Aureimonas sp. ME7]|uniref:ABC transporter substrate-binding protein n=1 Tax=Aureimonas sp. ME7 TaxID=2744252 RepID=UPI0015F4B408|nr:ABC transporter substrate-binding protein [Aureimonas sp. ME7]